MYFHYFVIISPWERAGPFIWTKLNPLHPMMLCAKFGWNWPSGSGEKDFKISSMSFHYFVIISPWERAGPFIWTKRESPSPKDALCQVLLKLAQWFWRRWWKCEKLTMTTTTTTDNGQILIRKASLEQTWIPFTQWCFVLNLNEIRLVVPKKKMKMWKVYRLTNRQTDRQTTDDRWSENLTWAFSSGELKSYGLDTNLHRQTDRRTDRQMDRPRFLSAANPYQWFHYCEMKTATDITVVFFVIKFAYPRKSNLQWPNLR